MLGETPAPIQTQLLAAKEFEVGMITGFAAGKTRGICAAALTHAVRYPEAKILLGRKTYAETVNTVKQPFFVMADVLANAGWFTKPLKWDYREGTNHARLLNGSQFFFSNLDDPVKFRNEEYSLVIVDQAEEITEELWEILCGRIRWAKVPSSGWQAIAAANDNGHNWVWRRFVHDPMEHAKRPTRCRANSFCVFDDGHPDEEGQPRSIPCSTRRFFHGTTLDNKHNLSPRYLSVLLSKPPEWQRHFIYATMEGGSGRLLPDPTIIPAFDPPRHWPRWRAIDHALNSPCCCLWITVNVDERPVGGVPPQGAYVYREYWAEHSSVDQHAARIRALSSGENILATVIDRSTFQLTQSREGGVRVSIADLYAEEGIPCAPSVGDPFARVERINVAHRRGLVVSEACPHLIRTMPEYYAEQSKFDGSFKILNKSDFHAVDALGYGLMFVPQDSRALLDVLDNKPEHLRNPDLEPLARRHHEAEWKRLKAIEDRAALEQLPAVGAMNIAEFWGDGDDVEIAGGYDLWGR